MALVKRPSSLSSAIADGSNVITRLGRALSPMYSHYCQALALHSRLLVCLSPHGRLPPDHQLRVSFAYDGHEPNNVQQQ